MMVENSVRLLRRIDADEQFGVPVRFDMLAASGDDGPMVARLGRSDQHRFCDIHNRIEQWVGGNLNAE
jgi:hypothetical protein